jgi:hypothetical protein
MRNTYAAVLVLLAMATAVDYITGPAVTAAASYVFPAIPQSRSIPV